MSAAAPSVAPAPRFVVMTSAAKGPNGCGYAGRYRAVAVVETDTLAIPAFISARARHLVRIVEHWGACSVGATDRCAYRIAMAEAEAMAVKLNAEANQ